MTIAELTSGNIVYTDGLQFGKTNATYASSTVTIPTANITNGTISGVINVTGQLSYPLDGQNFPKAASANLRHSHDAAIDNVTEQVLTKKKTLTFANGISGTLRFQYDSWVDSAVYQINTKIYKNGVSIDAAAHATNDIVQTTPKWSYDLNVGVLAPGDTLELWANLTGVGNGHLANFRISYDNASDVIAVPGVTTS